MWSLRKKLEVPAADQCLPGRAIRMPVPEQHFVNGHKLAGPYPAGLDQAVFGMGCFWGAERKFWEAPGVWTTAVGYAGGSTLNPTYEEVCSGRTGHTEVVLVVFDPKVTSYEALLKIFWESHDPTQGMRQGNDVGTQYRSAIYTYSPEQLRAAEASRERYQERLAASRFGAITSEIREAPRAFSSRVNRAIWIWSPNPCSTQISIDLPARDSPCHSGKLSEICGTTPGWSATRASSRGQPSA